MAEDTSGAILAATHELLKALVTMNDLNVDDVASIVFTVTPDLTSEYPARAARELGWTDTALLGATEMAVAGGLARCIRVLVHVNTPKPKGDLRHVYLHGARSLRPDQP